METGSGQSSRPCDTQGLLRYGRTDPARPSRLHHLQHWERSPTGSREMFCAVTSSTRAALRSSQESSPERLRPSVSLHGCRHFVSARCSFSPLSHPRDIQNTRAVQAQVLPVASSCRQPALLTHLLHHELRESSISTFELRSRIAFDWIH